MNVRKADYFIADVERQYEWYIAHAGREVADRYLEAVEASCALLGKHPRIGPSGGFEHPRLRDWRFFLVVRPFRKHLLFYEIVEDDVVMRRALHGHTGLPDRLLEPPTSS